MAKKQFQICKSFHKIGESELVRIKQRIMKKGHRIVYFKDEIHNKKRNLCFRGTPYEKDEVNPYTTNLTTIGLRKLGIRVIGIGKVR